MGSTAPPTPPQAPLRLAILEADTPVPNANAKYHGYRGVFTDLFRRAVAPDPLERHVAITGYDVVNEPGAYPDLAAVDAVLISGSKHSAYLDDAWILRLVEFARAALATGGRVRVVGVCFGHQILARALGARVDRNDKGWELAVTEIKLSEKGREVFGTETLKIHQMHRDIVFSNPEGAENLAENGICTTQGFLLPGRAITVQGHPEFTGDIVSEILELRHDAGVFTDDDYSSGVGRARVDHDGVAIAQAFLRFARGQEKYSP